MAPHSRAPEPGLALGDALAGVTGGLAAVLIVVAADLVRRRWRTWLGHSPRLLDRNTSSMPSVIREGNEPSDNYESIVLKQRPHDPVAGSRLRAGLVASDVFKRSTSWSLTWKVASSDGGCPAGEFCKTCPHGLVRTQPSHPLRAAVATTASL